MRGFLIFLTVAAWAQTPAPKTAPAPPAATPAGQARPAVPVAAAPKPLAANAMTDEQKVIYTLGLSIYRSLAQFGLSPAELDYVKKGLTDAAAGKPEVDVQVWGPKIQQFATARASVGAEQQKGASAAFLAKAATEPGAKKTDSGMIYKELRAGTGASPTAADSVKVNYRGTLVDGSEFDNSYKRGEPAEFPLTGVIKCWTEGVQMMKVGGKAQLVCPAEIAYGPQGRPGIPGGATLVFEVELLQITGAK